MPPRGHNASYKQPTVSPYQEYIVLERIRDRPHISFCSSPGDELKGAGYRRQHVPSTPGTQPGHTTDFLSKAYAVRSTFNYKTHFKALSCEINLQLQNSFQRKSFVLLLFFFKSHPYNPQGYHSSCTCSPNTLSSYCCHR